MQRQQCVAGTSVSTRIAITCTPFSQCQSQRLRRSGRKKTLIAMRCPRGWCIQPAASDIAPMPAPSPMAAQLSGAPETALDASMPTASIAQMQPTPPSSQGGSAAVTGAVVSSSILMLLCAVCVAKCRHRSRHHAVGVSDYRAHEGAAAPPRSPSRHEPDASVPAQDASTLGFVPVNSASFGQTRVVAAAWHQQGAHANVQHLRLPHDAARAPRRSASQQGRQRSVSLSKEDELRVCSVSLRGSEELSESSLQDLRM